MNKTTKYTILVTVVILLFTNPQLLKSKNKVATEVLAQETTVEQLQSIPEPKSMSQIVIDELVRKYAKQYNVSPNEMLRVIGCENKPLDPKLQSYIRYKSDNPVWGVKAGEREKSYGLVQIHLPSHPNISYEQATDPEFSIEFMAKKFSKGQASEWSCY